MQEKKGKHEMRCVVGRHRQLSGHEFEHPGDGELIGLDMLQSMGFKQSDLTE